MTRLEFRNRLCILRSIDRHELVEAGAIGADDDAMWRTFAADPYRWFLLRDDETAEKLWQLIERRAATPSAVHKVLAKWQEKLADLEDMKARGDLTKDWGECSLINTRAIVNDLTAALSTTPSSPTPALKAARAL
jgi:hypothetical protein